MKKTLLLLLPLTLFACSDDNLNDIPEQPVNTPTEEVTLTRATLTAIPSSQDRVTYALSSKAEELGTLNFYAELENPALDNNLTGLNLPVPGEDYGRYLSATSVYSVNGTYYVTYHMQGKNYNHDYDSEKEVAGFIETFTIADDGSVVPEAYYVSENRDEVDFDFNHIYYDGTDLITVGHRWDAPTGNGTGTNGQQNLHSMIGKLNLTSSAPSVEFKNISTGDKNRDEQDTSLADEDAGDGNSVVKSGDKYYVTTRKGLAVLDNDFNPVIGADNNKMFYKTPGSAKHIVVDNSGKVSMLYLEGKVDAEDLAQTSNLPAYIATVNTGATVASELVSGSPTPLPHNVSPVDGKNVLATDGTDFYACLGTGGLYFGTDTPKRFGGFEDNAEGEPVYGKGRSVNGVALKDDYIFVANGTSVSVLKKTENDLELVAKTWSPSVNKKNADGSEKAEKAIEAEQGSANYVIVDKADGVYTVAVAYGQAGVRIFKFTPATAEPEVQE